MAQRESRKAAGPGEGTESQQTWAGRQVLLTCSNTRCPACLSFSFLNCKMGMTLVCPFEGCSENSVQCQGRYTLPSLPLPRLLREKGLRASLKQYLGDKEGHRLGEQREEVVAARV